MLIDRIAIKACGWLADRWIGYFQSLKLPLQQARLRILFRTYVARIIFLTGLTFIFSFVGSLNFFIQLPLIWALAGSLLLAGFLSSLVFMLLYLYPVHEASSRKRSIESNLPFATSHMAAIASSGLPPYIIFKMLLGFEEYGEIAREARMIVRNVDSFGQDIVTAMKQLIRRSPSRRWSELLQGIISTIETGGNLLLYLQLQARDAMLDYRLKREKYMQSLSTYADFYTGVLIAGPLFLISILAVMNLIGGTIGGLGLTMTCAPGVSPSLLGLLTGECVIGAMELGIYLAIPLANIAFISFIHFTQPEVI
jgi:flagellar protein FlaJ